MFQNQPLQSEKLHLNICPQSICPIPFSHGLMINLNTQRFFKHDRRQISGKNITPHLNKRHDSRYLPQSHYSICFVAISNQVRQMYEIQEKKRKIVPIALKYWILFRVGSKRKQGPTLNKTTHFFFYTIFLIHSIGIKFVITIQGEMQTHHFAGDSTYGD